MSHILQREHALHVSSSVCAAIRGDWNVTGKYVNVACNERWDMNEMRLKQSRFLYLEGDSSD